MIPSKNFQRLLEFSKLEVDLTLYSARSFANEEDLFSSNLAGESYSAITPAQMHKKTNNKKKFQVPKKRTNKNDKE